MSKWVKFDGQSVEMGELARMVDSRERNMKDAALVIAGIVEAEGTPSAAIILSFRLARHAYLTAFDAWNAAQAKP